MLGICKYTVTLWRDRERTSAVWQTRQLQLPNSASAGGLGASSAVCGAAFLLDVLSMDHPMTAPAKGRMRNGVVPNSRAKLMPLPCRRPLPYRADGNFARKERSERPRLHRMPRRKTPDRPDQTPGPILGRRGAARQLQVSRHFPYPRLCAKPNARP